jgi:hypothetical protein
MLGRHSESVFFNNLGTTDNSTLEFEIEAYLGGMLECYFSNWGQDGNNVDPAPPTIHSVGSGCMKAVWTGIMGLQPWVGHIPSRVSGRPKPVSDTPEKGEVMSNSLASNILTAGQVDCCGIQW